MGLGVWGPGLSHRLWAGQGTLPGDREGPGPPEREQPADIWGRVSGQREPRHKGPEGGYAQRVQAQRGGGAAEQSG